MKTRGLIVVPAFALLAGAGAPDDDTTWMRWRGPLGTGYAPDCNPPSQWTESNNVRWKVQIPGSGYASPIIHGDNVYVLTAVKVGEAAPSGDPAPEPAQQPGRRGRRPGGRRPTDIFEFRVVAVDRTSGDVAWSTPVCEAQPHEGKHSTGSYAPNSPVTDGEHIFAHFGSRGLYCLDMEGNVVWDHDFGDMRTRLTFGEGASPALHEDKLVVPWDHEGESFVAVLEKSTGDEIWRVDRDEATTWSTPLIVEVNGRNQVILSGTEASISYDLDSGEEIWRCAGLGLNVVPTPLTGHGMVYLMSGYRGSYVIAVKLDEARGDITGTDAIAWTHNRGAPYVPSAMLSGRNLYFLGSNNGILSCFDAITGEENYSGQRLGEVRNVYSSIVGAGGRLYVCGRDGNVAVIEEGDEYKLIATNTMDEGINATPAIVGDEMYIRTSGHLYCVARGAN